ncbi:hypothetical protein K431DRAFT_232391, partial [Polychaeton citri CBS 116435]
SDLDSKCAKAQPWVRRFVEDYQDGSPWGYAIFEDPTIDEEVMEECMCRIDTLLWFAKDTVFGRGHEEFPRFKWEVLDWPEGGDEGDGDDQQGDGERPAEEDGNGDGGEDDVDAEDDAGEGTEKEVVDDNQEGEDEDDEDDADIELVRELPSLRTHFKWVCERAKKRRKAHESLDVDRSGISHGLVRNVFLVIDQDAIDSIVAISPMADLAWVWAIDPDYIGDVVSMTRNGLKDEYYGYMRVRVQQLVNNFWDTRRYHEDDLPLPVLWEAAKQSHNFAFVSVDPQEAQMLGGSMNSGSALRAQTG